MDVTKKEPVLALTNTGPIDFHDKVPTHHG